jgi:uncharacterized OB-fold protein
MSDAPLDEVKIVRTYPAVGIGGASWVLVEPGLFDYPVPKGEKPALLASRCSLCGKRFFPQRPLCPHCFEQDTMEQTRLGTRGVVYCSTVVNIPSPVGIKPPYAYGYVDIPENDIRVFGLFTGAPAETFKPGLNVELVIDSVGVDKQGRQVVGYKFKPVR